jgi:hypothetical protein
MDSTSDRSETSAEAGGSNVPALLSATRRALRNGRMGAATKTASDILAATSNLRQLKQAFAEVQKLDALVQLIWDRRESALRRLTQVAAFMRMCEAAEHGDVHFRKLRAWLLDESTAPLSFSFQAVSDGFWNLKAGRAADLFRFKYRGWDSSSPEKLAESVAAFAERCVIPQHVLEFLYERRANRQVEFPEWLRDLKSAQIFAHFARDGNLAKSLLRKGNGQDRAFLRQFKDDAALPNIVDMARAKLFFEGLDTSRGLLFCLFHGGFSYVLNPLFVRLMPGHYAIGKSNFVGPDGLEEERLKRGVAFRAMKALMQKKAVRMAPDGRRFGGAAAVEIRIFDQPLQISGGGAQLAYDAGSDTGWCTMVRDNGRFVPHYVPGPRRSPDETFGQFRDRWVSFYSAQIEAVFTSDPKSIDLTSPRAPIPQTPDIASED